VPIAHHDLSVRHRRAGGIEIGPMHVGADGSDRAALAAGQVLGQQRGGGRFASVLTQSDDLAVHHIGEHSPESLLLAALNLFESDMSRLPFQRVRSDSARNAFSARRALSQLTPWRMAA
jgi:hypothetical protein